MSQGNSESGLRKPEEGEMLGVVAQLVGYDRAKVKCSDEKIRVCRIPGRMKKKVWVRDGDIVIVAPWDFQADTRGDIVYRYQREEVRRLKAEGYDVPS